MKKKLLGVLLCTTMVASMLAGCGGSGSSSDSDSSDSASGEGETITMMAPEWAIPSDDQLDAFTEETGIEVEISEVGWDDIREKLATAATANQCVADVVEFDWSWVGEFDAAGWVEPIELSDEDMEDFLTLDTFTVDGKVLGVPYSNDFRVAFYNKAQFDEAELTEPQTYDDMLAAARVLKEKGIADYPITTSLNAEEKASTGLMWTAFQMNGVVWNEDGTFNEESIKKALDWYQAAIDEELVAPEDKTSSGMEAYRRLCAGTASMLVGPTAFVTMAQDENESSVVGKVETILCPGGDAKATVTMALPEALAITSTSEHKEAAKTFIEWYTSPEMQKELSATLGSLPTRASILKELVDDGTIANAGAMLEQADTIASPFPNGVPAYYAELSSAMYNAMNKMALGEIDAAKAYEEMETALEDLLAE